MRITNRKLLPGGRIRLMSDDTLTLAMEGEATADLRMRPEERDWHETTPRDLADIFLPNTLRSIARWGDENDREKVERALKFKIRRSE